MKYSLFWRQLPALAALFATSSLAGFNLPQSESAICPDGNKVAVWREVDTNVAVIKSASWHHAASHWTTPVNISTGDTNSFAPQVAVDEKFRGIAVWLQDDVVNGVNALMAAKKYDTDAWDPPVRLSNITQHVREGTVELAVDEDGHILVVWEAVMVNTNENRAISRKAKLSSFTWSSELMLNP